jgi:peptidoglycan/LPS O-acetylase OafA/YrhL
MRRDLVTGVGSAIVTGLAAYALTFIEDPGSMGRSLATALALCLTAAPTGVAAGLIAAGLKPAVTAAAASAVVQLALLAVFYALVWTGSWDLPALVSFAVTLQAAAMVATGGLTGALRRRAKPRD